MSPRRVRGTLPVGNTQVPERVRMPYPSHCAGKPPAPHTWHPAGCRGLAAKLPCLCRQGEGLAGTQDRLELPQPQGCCDAADNTMVWLSCWICSETEGASAHPALAPTCPCTGMGGTYSWGVTLCRADAVLARRCSPWLVRTVRTGASPAWMRGWRTSSPRGSSQRSCRKPSGGA